MPAHDIPARHNMTLVSPRTFLQALQAAKAKPNCVLFGQSPLSFNPPSRFLSRAFNSSVSYQPSVDACEHFSGEEHEEVQVQLSESLEQKFQHKGGKVFEGGVQVRLSAKLEQKVHQKGKPLKDVVANCVGRWFKDYLKNAEAGDPDAQMTVGQMFCSGYGVPKDLHKGQDWIKKAQWKRKTLQQTKGPHNKRKAQDEDYFFV